MRIAVVSTPIFKLSGPQGTSGYSGLESLAWHTAAGLARRGHQVYLVAPDGSDCPGAHVVSVGPAMGIDEKGAYDKYWQLLLQVDCVVDHSWQKWAYALKQEGRLKAPVLGVCHAPVNTMFQSPPPVDKPCMVCISKDQGAHFEGLFGRPCRICYNGVDPTYYKSTGAPRSGRFLFLARFSTIKGPDLAIEACRQAGVGLDLVGDTQITNEPEFLERIKGMCDGEQIRMVGPATRAEVVWWLSQAHCLIHPNQRFREPFGLAPVEAMLCGCPVIAWDNGAMRETTPNTGLVGDGPPGWLVRSPEELVGSVRQATMPFSEFQRRSVRDHAQQFSLEIMVNRYDYLCQEAVKTGGW